MKIFKWAIEIEKVYEDLIKNAKEENLAEIQVVRNNQEKMFEFALIQKQEFTSSALKNLHEEVDVGIKKFRNQLNKNLKNIEEHYQKNKDNLIKSIIEKLELEF